MKIRKRSVAGSLFILFGLSLVIPRMSWSQLVLGQYEDEAPFRTWNTFGFSSASSLGWGEAHYTVAADSSAAFSNPALLSLLPRMTFTLNGSVTSASFFKFSVVNTGVLSSEGNLSSAIYALDYAGISLNLGNLALAVNAALTESYDRPAALYEYRTGGTSYYTFSLDQSGYLRNINLSLSTRLNGFLSLGLGFNYFTGDLHKDISEEWYSTGIAITDNKSHTFRGYFLNGGLLLELSEKFSLAAVFRMPFTKKSESESRLRYLSPRGDTDIQINASSHDTYKQPLAVGAGVGLKPVKELRLAADLTYYNWSEYTINSFGEELERNFKDILKFSAGIEYTSSARLFSQPVQYPFRVGFSYDPQPMKNPSSRYFYFCMGTGIHWKSLLLDMAVHLGREDGSGNSLSARRSALSLSYQF